MRSELAGLNAAVASLYNLTVADFEHIAGTFPLVPVAERTSGAPPVHQRRRRWQRVSFPFSVTRGVMTNKRGRLQLGIIWGLVAGLAVLQVALWSLAGSGPDTAAVLYLVAGWVVVLSLAVLASRGIGTLTERLAARETAHRATLDEVQQLQTQNAMLQIVARSVDVGLTFQALAVRIAGLVRCDRVGLALLTESGQEFETFTARVQEDERRNRPRPDVVFKVESTAIGQVVRTLEPILINDASDADADLLDVNVLMTAGFKSALIVPLVSSGRGVGTLNVVSRTPRSFQAADIDTLRPIAEILAVAHVAQQLHMLLGKHRTTEAMADVMLSIAADINSALQIIVGHCDLLERGYPDPQLQRDLATVVRQAQRISDLLEKMRTAANDRLKEVAHVHRRRRNPHQPRGLRARSEAMTIASRILGIQCSSRRGVPERQRNQDRQHRQRRSQHQPVAAGERGGQCPDHAQHRHQQQSQQPAPPSRAHRRRSQAPRARESRPAAERS